MANRYAKTPIVDEASYQKKLEKTREYLHPETEVFEFGCGTGSTAITHAPLVRHILATDGSIKMIEIARGRAEAAGIENITFDAVTIDTVSAPADTYDVVLGMSILHLVKNKEAVIAKVHSLLKPGGVFISSTACLGDNSILITLLTKVMWMIGITVRSFTQEQLKASLIDAGFEIEHEWLPDGDGVKATFIVARKRN